MSNQADGFKFLFFLGILVFSIITSIRSGFDRQKNPEGGRGRDGFSISDWFLSLFTLLRKPDPEAQARLAASDARQQEIIAAIHRDVLPASVADRLTSNRDGTAPWIATLSPAELSMVGSYGIRPIAAVSATCWMQYGYSWTKGHAQGWETAIRRLKYEAMAAGANAVLDVKMRTIPIDIGSSMDFSLVGTAVKVNGLEPSNDPIIATVPALEFVRLLQADIVPVGIAIGAEFRWIADWQGNTNLFWAGNTECTTLSGHWKYVRDRAVYDLRQNVKKMGTGALAHVNFSQMFEREGGNNQPKQYLARHIVIATVIDAMSQPAALPPFQMVVDLHAGKTPLAVKHHQHQSYALSEKEGPI